MSPKRTGNPALDALYTVRRGSVDVVDVPELGFAVVDGRGGPDDPAFADAIQALYAVSYGAHFAIKQATGDAPPVMPLEALWWVEGPDQQAAVEAVAGGGARMEDIDRSTWCWRAMIMQPAPIDAAAIATARDAAATTHDAGALDGVHYERWTEGPSAQIMHVGPYAAEQASIMALHAAIAARGLRALGRHHEIYLSDPRRTAPEKLRTILRHPVAPIAPSDE